MLLYHGTSAKHIESILEHGLIPRGKAESNWPASSSEHHVYLTQAYGMYFAQSARKAASEDLLIVEVDTTLLDERNLHADEDSAAFSWGRGNLASNFAPPPGADLKQQAMHFSSLLPALADDGFDHVASLEMLGNCSHHGVIPVSAISRILRYDASEGPWWLTFHDPVISTLNFRFHGSEYIATQLVVAERLAEAHGVSQAFPSMIDLDAVEEFCARRRTVVFDRTHDLFSKENCSKGISQPPSGSKC